MKYSCVVLLLLSLSFSLNAAPKEGKVVDPLYTRGNDREIEVDNPDVLEAANFAVSQISLFSPSLQQLGLFKVLSATYKVAYGASAYVIKLQVGQTNCTKSPTPRTQSVCVVNPSTATEDDPNFGEFIVRVFDQPWRSPRFMISSVQPVDEKTEAKEAFKNISKFHL